MFDTEKYISEVLTRPDAVKILNVLSEKLKEEQRKRHQFYNDITEQEKAEFINGEIIIHSPVKKMHNDANANVFMLINAYVQFKKLGFVGIEKIMISLTRNDYEPDICFFKKEKSDSFKREQVLFPAPDLVVEVLSKGTAGNDRGVKFNDYESHEIQEYWIVNPDEQVIEQYVLDSDKKYDLKIKSDSGFLESTAIEGFKIKIKAIFDKEENLMELNRLIGS